jgi:hypothetical protein
MKFGNVAKHVALMVTCAVICSFCAGMASITSRLQAERQLYKEKLKECAAPLQRLVSAHLPAFLNPSSSAAAAAAAAADAAAAGGGGAAGGGWQVGSALCYVVILLLLFLLAVAKRCNS